MSLKDKVYEAHQEVVKERDYWKGICTQIELSIQNHINNIQQYFEGGGFTDYSEGEIAAFHIMKETIRQLKNKQP